MTTSLLLRATLAAAAVVYTATGALVAQRAEDGRARLAASRKARNLDALGSLRARPLRIEYSYGASSAPDQPGTLTLEFGRPGLYHRFEVLPWQTFHTSTTRLDARRFEREYSDGTETSRTGTPAAEANLRAAALADWLGVLHEVPDWAAVDYVPVTDGEAVPGVDVVRIRGVNLDVRLEFDRVSGWLARMIQRGTMTAGPSAARRSATPASITTTFEDYRTFKGVTFAASMRLTFSGGPPAAKDQSFTARITRVTF